MNPSTFDRRIPRAELIIWLDRSRWACLWRIARRVIGSYGRVRPDMAERCPERIDVEFIRYVWRFPKVYRPRIPAALDRYDAHQRTVILRSDAEGDVYLAGWGRLRVGHRAAFEPGGPVA
jgi:adenylate kinase family enzyme